MDGGREVVLPAIRLTPIDPLVTHVGEEGGAAQDSSGQVTITFAPGDVPVGGLDVTITPTEGIDAIQGPSGDDYFFLFNTGVEITVDPDADPSAIPFTLRTPNIKGLPAGLTFPVTEWSATTATWETVGSANVSVDGQSILVTVIEPNPNGLAFKNLGEKGFQKDLEVEELVDVRFPHGNIHPDYRFIGSASPAGVISQDQNGLNPCQRNGLEERDFGSSVDPSSGRLLCSHSIPAISVRGQRRSLNLLYRSNTADPKTLITATVSHDQNFLTPVRVHWRMEISGNEQRAYFIGTKDTWRGGALWDATDSNGEKVPSGSYPYNIENTTFHRGGNWRYTDPAGTVTYFTTQSLVPFQATKTGRAIVVNESDSPFGAGWQLAEISTLHVDPDGYVVLNLGSGKTTVFQPDGSGGFVPTSPEGLTLVVNGDGTYTLTSISGIQTLFSPDGRHLSTTDRNGNMTRYDYDGFGRIDAIVEIHSGDLIEREIFSIRYDGGGKVSSVTDLVGRMTEFEVSPSGDLTEITNPDGTARAFSYDDRHLLVAQSDERGAETRYVYDERGLIKRSYAPGESNPRSVTTRFGYWPGPDVLIGSPVQYTRATSIVDNSYSFEDSLGNRTEYVGFRGAHQHATLTDPLGRKTKFLFDESHRPVSVTRPNDSLQSLEYDEAGHLTRLVEEDATPGPAEVSLEYDGPFDLLSAAVDPEGARTETEYDSYGNIALVRDAHGEETHLSNDASGLLVSATDAAGGAIEIDRYPDGNLRRLINPLGHAVEFAYDTAGNVTTVTDALGHPTRFEYDIMNRLTRIVDALGHPTTFDYDTGGNLIRKTNPRGAVTRYGYDLRGRLVSMTDPLGNSEFYTYDSEDNLVTFTDRNGSTIRYVYDGAFRLVERVAPDLLELFTYDEMDNLIIAVNRNSALTMEYDALGRLTSMDPGQGILLGGDPSWRPQRAFTYAYDRRGRRTSMKDPLGGTTSYDYDLLGRLTSLTDPYGGVFDFEYDEVGRRERLGRPNHTYTDYSYDPVGQLLAIDHVREGSGPFLSLAYDYDPNGQRLQQRIARQAQSVTLDYEYDALGQLIRAGVPPVLPGSGDSYDIRDVSYEYDIADRLLEDDQNLYSYDFNGNMVRKTEKATGTTFDYEYSSDNRLVGTSLSASASGILPVMIASYDHDALGRRVSKYVNGFVEGVLLDLEDVVARSDGALNAVSYFVHSHGIDEPLSVVTQSGQAFSHTDALGSLVSLSNSLGVSIENSTFSAFGTAVSQESGSDLYFGYTGRVNSPELGPVLNYRFREYSSMVGRFSSEDPISTDNLYSYVANDPLGYVDPFGLRGDTWGDQILDNAEASGKPVTAASPYQWYAECVDPTIGEGAMKSAYGLINALFSSLTFVLGVGKSPWYVRPSIGIHEDHVTVDYSLPTPTDYVDMGAGMRIDKQGFDPRVNPGVNTATKPVKGGLTKDGINTSLVNFNKKTPLSRFFNKGN